MSFKRREFLLFISAGLGAATLNSCGGPDDRGLPSSSPPETAPGSPGFKPVRGPMPLPTDDLGWQPAAQWQTVSTLTESERIGQYRRYEVVDDLVLPEGFTYDTIAVWGDPVGDSRFGYNNDYLSFVETGNNEGFLTVNFEYVSPRPWLEAYEQVIGRSLPVDTVQAALEAQKNSAIDAFSLPADDPLRKAILEISEAGLTDMGIGVISVRREADGRWVRTYSPADRRITGISGWLDGRYLKSTGPAAAVFRKGGRGYDDRLGDRIVGTFANCAGGTSPWGTVFSAEENFQTFVPEAVYPDGTSVSPSETPFSGANGGLGNVLGLAGNKYGWMVEVDPADPEDYGTKHTWLGRYRHEAVGIRAVAGKPLAVYSGCDRRGGHLYKFVSRDRVADPGDRQNSRLLEMGMLYGAKFHPDGTGRWIPLRADTPVDPDPAGVHVGRAIALPRRPEGGSFLARSDREVDEFKRQYKTLGDLYLGDPETRQGAILTDAHLAASAAGVTCTARPEDTDIAPDGSLYIAFTSGSPDASGEGPDGRIFRGPGGAVPHEAGWIVRLIESGDDPGAMQFRWEMFATGGQIAAGGAGFANPDNLAFDGKGNLWMVTDLSTGVQNRPVSPAQAERLGIYGNNSVWVLPTSGPNAGNAYLFAIGPMECEMCGPFLTPDGQTLFLAAQHPGEYNGMRQNMASEIRKFAMTTPDGQEFIQTREVPIGSNWPGRTPDDPPKPAVVAIRRKHFQAIV